MISVTVAIKDDWQDFKKIRLEALQEEPQAFGSSYAKESVYTDEKWQESFSKPDVAIVIAKETDKPVGMIGYHLKNNSDAHIWGMFVSKDYRNKGIGKMLLEKLIDQAKQILQVQKISLDVNPEQVTAVKLYSSLGFQGDGTRKFLMGDEVERELMSMVLELS